MSLPIIGDVIREVGATIRELVPDADKRLELEGRLAELADQADARESALLQGQIGVNAEEAKHSNIFVAGWRPAIGWSSAIALNWTWWMAPLLQWIAQLTGIETTIPALDPNAMYPIVLAMLGVSASRTVEKMQGVATSMGGKILANERDRPVAPGPTSKPVQVLKKTASRWF